ncbi:transcriptional regulator [Streptomyces sp. JJ36]|uniref:transcriptional regulator n=1 Tax=Streptomyces sp. JJ36 TaxID=2736645 RepID=UPI001F44D099|nr:transcriptional regulator [Streptomyces sp. JJ36]MCF6525562.1 transcriptional regulator [Streptomyces sp. JJ36]
MTAADFPLLLRLADERATGALLSDTGTLYLHDGHVVHAESPASPGLETLLVTPGRLPAEGWREAVDQAGAQRRVGRHLVETGRLAPGELEICHLGALHDAAYFALAPAAGPRRFRHGVAHWLGPVRRVPAPAVVRETRRRRELLAGVWPYDQVDDAPLVRRDPAHAAPPTPRQRAVLALADGARRPVDIARLLGRPAFHTLIDVRRLAAAGLVETPPVPGPYGHPPVPSWVAGVCPDPDTALLRRLRDALEAL